MYWLLVFLSISLTSCASSSFLKNSEANLEGSYSSNTLAQVAGADQNYTNHLMIQKVKRLNKFRIKALIFSGQGHACSIDGSGRVEDSVLHISDGSCKVSLRVLKDVLIFESAKDEKFAKCNCGIAASWNGHTFERSTQKNEFVEFPLP